MNNKIVSAKIGKCKRSADKRGTGRRMIARGDHRADSVLGVLTIPNGRRAIWRGSAHEHFVGDERNGQVQP